MTRTTIWLATSSAYPALTDDDRLLGAALQQQGLAWAPLEWRSPVQPDAGDAVVIRSCWDYHLHAGEFVAWLDRLENGGVRLANGYAAVRSTLHKRYLLELQARGVATIAPTELVAQGTDCLLADIASRLGSRSLVVKPAVSLSAHDTWRTEAPDVDQQRFRASVASGDVLVQAYLPAIETDGELSLVFLGGRYSHAVLKHPKAGDFRVQLDHGGRVVATTPADVHVEAAARLLAAAAPQALYARVDGIARADGLLLMELELIDPVLHFARSATAATQLARALAAWAQAPASA